MPPFLPLPNRERARGMDVLVASSRAMRLASQKQLDIVGEVLVLGGKRYDASRVELLPDESPVAFHLRLLSGTRWKTRQIVFGSEEERDEMEHAINVWLRRADAVAVEAGEEEAEEQEHEEDEEDGDGVDGMASKYHRASARREALAAFETAAEEQRFSRALAATGSYVCRRTFCRPAPLCVVVLAMGCLGLGMVNALAAEAAVRLGGKWFNATCDIHGYVFVAKEVRLRTYENARAKDHTGVSMWLVTGAYNATVRFGDGCDGDADHMPGLLEVLETVADEQDLGYAVVEPGDPSLVRIGREVEASGAELRIRGDPPMVPLPAAEAVDIGEEAEDGLPGDDGANAEDSDADEDGDECTRAESRFDEVRGLHVAFHKLISHYDDHCIGPVGATESEAIARCTNTSGLWFRHRYLPEERRPCWLFAHRERQHNGARQERVHVVLDWHLPALIVLYIAYWVALGVLVAWQGVLLFRAGLERAGIFGGGAKAEAAAGAPQADTGMPFTPTTPTSAPADDMDDSFSRPFRARWFTPWRRRRAKQADRHPLASTPTGSQAGSGDVLSML